MRIFSKFRDYYDSVQQHGFDDHVVYERETSSTFYPATNFGRTKPTIPAKEVLPGTAFAHPKLHYNQERTKWYSIRDPYRQEKWRGPSRAVMVVCGKAYPFYIAHNAKTGSVTSFNSDFDELVEQDLGKTPKWARRYRGPNNAIPYRDWLADNPVFEVGAEAHFIVGAPIFLLVEYTLIANPCLVDFDFHKVIDPYTAFQEIDMFLGGVMGTVEKESPPMTDKEKVSAHGMDPKWSFRKQSSEK